MSIKSRRADDVVGAILEPIDDLIEESEQLWHQCKDSYHDPVRFRTNLNALIQLTRNSTWRVQSLKESIHGFDVWYGEWQALTKRFPAMAWVNDARLDIVKRKGLDSHSRALVRVIDSYNEPYVVSFTVQPKLSTEAIYHRVRAQVPEILLDHCAIEITRKWVVDKYPDHEILGVLSECICVITAIRRDLLRHINGEARKTPDVCIAEELGNPALTVDAQELTLRMLPGSGQSYEWIRKWVPYDPKQGRKAAKRYGADLLKLTGNPTDSIEFAEALVPLAKMMLEKDGYHNHLVWLHKVSGEWELTRFVPTSQIDKFLFWQGLAQRVEREGIDGFVYISEVWMAPVTSLPSGRYPVASESKDRIEALSIYAENRDGATFIATYPFSRSGGTITVGPEFQNDVLEEHIAAPLRRVWARYHAQADGPAEHKR